MSQKALEALQREYPVKLNERRGRKPAGSCIHQTQPTQVVVTHESLAVMEVADGDPLTTQPEFTQSLVSSFFQLLASASPRFVCQPICICNMGSNILQRFLRS